MNVLRSSLKTIFPVYSQYTALNSASRSQVLITKHHKCFHLTATNHDLMEFFDSKDNLGKTSIKHGRSWTADELRIKSNSDLHKLWFVLLKEKNMLLTMEEEYKRNVEIFPSPERIDKVEESMANLETVVRERNEAYYYLETGKTGERPIKTFINAFGDLVRHRAVQHIIPEVMNKSYRQKYLRFKMDEFAYKFQNLKLEQKLKEIGRAKSRQRNHVAGLFKRFKTLDEAAMKEKFPDADIDKIKERSENTISDNWKNRYF